MHVGLVRSRALVGGGITRVIESWARVLAAAGHAVSVVAEAGDSPVALPSGVACEAYPVGSRSAAGRRYGSRRAAVAAIASLDRRQRLDLVVSHDPFFSPALRRALPDRPLLETFHSPAVEEVRLNTWTYASPARRALHPAYGLHAWATDRNALAAISCAHTLSAYTWRLLSARYPRACARLPWVQIAGSYDDGRFVPSEDRTALRRRLSLPEEATLLLSIRRLIPRNGVDRIVRAARALRERLDGVHFLIGGTGPEEARLRARVREAGLDAHFHMLGFVPEADLAAYYQVADAFLLPTRDLECFGLPVVEAMACGCTPLVMPDGGPEEICRDLPGSVAAENSAEAFTALLARFLDGGIPERGDALARLAVERYSEAALAPSILRLVEELASGRPVSGSGPDANRGPA